MTAVDKIYKCFRELEDEGYISSVRKDYSGRGMYGEECLAIVPADDSFIVGLYLGQLIEINYPEDSEELLDKLSRYRTDSMGRGEVVYFPRLSADDLTEDEEDSNE